MTVGTPRRRGVMAAGKLFVANATNSSLTAVPTATWNQTTTTGCSSPTQIASGGHLSSPSALAVNGSTLYVGNGKWQGRGLQRLNECLRARV